MISMSKTIDTAADAASTGSKGVGLGGSDSTGRINLSKGSGSPVPSSARASAAPAASRPKTMDAFSRAVESSAPAIRAGAPFQNSLLDPANPASLLNSTNPLSPLNVTTGLVNPASPFSVFKL